MIYRNLLGVYSIWLRDVTRFRRDRYRLISSVAQPSLYLFIFGVGLSSGLSMGRNLFKGILPAGQDYVSFIYPGILGMTILFTSIFSAISIVWDREFGFLKEVMVAPISRWTVAVGKALGGSTVALIQGIIVLAFAPFIGVPLSLWVILALIPTMLIIAFSLTTMGLVVAARMESMEGFQMVMNFLVMPMFLLSGAMFPLTNLPAWLKSLTILDPLSYGVDALRYLLFGRQASLMSYSMDMGLVVIFALLMGSVSVWLFSRKD